MEWVWVRSSIAALLLFLTLLVLVASGYDAAPAAATAVEEQCHPMADDDEPYKLITLQHKDGEEIRLLADQRAQLVSGYANRSGHWFYATGRRRDGDKRRLNQIPLPVSRGGGTEGLWNTLGALANTTAGSDGDDDDDDERFCYMLVDMETGGGDKNRLVVLVANKRYMSVTGFAQGFSSRPNWNFREGLVLPLGDDVCSSHGGGGGSHAAEVVASKLLGALMNSGVTC